MPARVSDEELEQRQRAAEEAVRRAEQRAADELMQLEYLRSAVRAWQGGRRSDTEDGT